MVWQIYFAFLSSQNQVYLHLTRRENVFGIVVEYVKNVMWTLRTRWHKDNRSIHSGAHCIKVTGAEELQPANVWHKTFNKSTNYFHIFGHLYLSTDCFSSDTFPCWLGCALCVTEEIGWRRRSVCFQYDPWRENRLRADITPHCDRRGQTGEATHTSLPSPDTCPAPQDLSHIHTQNHHTHVNACMHTHKTPSQFLQYSN